jgi:WD40 repeat protein
MPDGQSIVTGGFDGHVTMRDVWSGDAQWTIPARQGAVHAVAVSANGQYVATAFSDGALKIIDAASGRVIREIPDFNAGQIALVGDGTWVASLGIEEDNLPSGAGVHRKRPSQPFHRCFDGDRDSHLGLGVWKIDHLLARRASGKIGRRHRGS